LPLLIRDFRLAALQAVIVNKAIGPRRRCVGLAVPCVTVPFSTIAANWPIVVSLLAGSPLGAWFGAGWAPWLASHTLYHVIAILLVVIAIIPVLGHDTAASGALLTGAAQMAMGVAAGFVIGVVAALLGVAGLRFGPRDRP
jgi:hypothetical protein